LGKVSIDLVVRVDNNSNGMLMNDDYTVVSDHAALVNGEPISTLVGRIYFLPMMVNSP
jgi:hypothetical protein